MTPQPCPIDERELRWLTRRLRTIGIGGARCHFHLELELPKVRYLGIVGITAQTRGYVRGAPFKCNDALLHTLPIGVIVFPGSGITGNLADKARILGIPVWRFDGGGG